MITNHQSNNGLILFREGVSAKNLIDFYNQPNFKNGKPVYNPHSIIIGSEEEMKDAGVVVLAVPQSVIDYLVSTGWKGKSLTKISVATDALITLAGIDGLGEVTEDEFRQAATRKTIGDRGDSYEALVQSYLKVFPHLLMTQTNQDPKSAPLRTYRPNEGVLAQYKARGIVPAPLKASDGNLERRAISLNIPHQLSLGLGDADLVRASPEAVKQLYAQFVR